VGDWITMLDTLVVAAGNQFPAAGQGSADRDAALSETLLCGFVGSFENRVCGGSLSFDHGCSLDWRAFQLSVGARSLASRFNHSS
jgi:hypothetical protein